MKLWKWHTLVFRCPCCGKGEEYAAQIVAGDHKGSYWDPAYWCEKCSTPVRARDTWIYGAVFGPLMLITGTLAFDAVTLAWAVPQPGALAFAVACAAIVGWPLSRGLSRRLLYWEPREPAALQRARVRRLREVEE
ncbi:MAG TPA: hypothetical protein VD867_01320 [Burkholderiales bacterium]|nr:hypothetical protein [Burkholderiales bacterium]